LKKQKLVLGLLILAIILSGCTTSKSSVDNVAQKSKKLIVYYSLTGNAKFVTEQIQSLTGADIFELELVDPYPVEFEATLERVSHERQSGYRPTFASRIDNIADYDVIFIGSPVWFGSLSIPVLAFLESYDLSGKTIVPFITFGRGGIMNTITELKELCPNSTILEEFGVSGDDVKNSGADISQWLEKIGMLK